MLRQRCIIGQRFDYLVVIETGLSVPTGSRQGLRSACRVRCICGSTKIITENQLFRGNTKSCGCLKRELCSEGRSVHGGRTTRLYSIWASMRTRCSNPKSSMYYTYGARGIAVCEQWDSFPAFQNWALANGYQDHLTLDRANNDGPYSPSNCRWATRSEQASNTSRNVWITCWGETKTRSDWAKDPRCVVPMTTLRYRIANGWPVEQALTRPSV